MCYFSYGKDGETMHTARNDIRCYKIVKKLQTEGQPSEYVSFYRGKTYKPGETYEAEFGVVEGPTYEPGGRNDDPRWPSHFWHINEGLHAFSDQCAFFVRKRETENVTDITVANKCIPHIPIIDIDETLLIETSYGVEVAVLWCRIPKGAHFYENQGGEIVTDTLYIVGEKEPESETGK